MKKNYKYKISHIEKLVSYYRDQENSSFPVYIKKELEKFPKDYESFLTNQTMIEKFFSKPTLNLNDIKYYTWVLRDTEHQLIKNKTIPENHLYKKYLEEIARAKVSYKEELYGFFTMMFFEDNSIHKHWNYSEEIEKSVLDKLIIKSLYDNVSSYKKFIKLLGNQRLSETRLVSDDGKEINLKNKFAKDIIYGFGSLRTQHKKLFNMIEKELNINDDIEQLVSILDINTISLRNLHYLSYAPLNSFTLKHAIANKTVTTTVENFAKFNSMEKNLNSCLFNDLGYDFNGNTYTKEHIGELINTFDQDPFLSSIIVDFMKNKSEKANKQENRSMWRYHALLLESQRLNKEEITQKKFKI